MNASTATLGLTVGHDGTGVVNMSGGTILVGTIPNAATTLGTDAGSYGFST